MSKRKSASISKTKETDLEKSYLKETGLDNLDTLDPTKSKTQDDKPPPITMVPSASAAPLAPTPVSTEDLGGKTKLEAKTASSLLYGYMNTLIVHPTQGKTSSYLPSCHMMDYIVHCMNETLCDNFYFKRETPLYHPYILRLYFGVIFWVQCLRAGNDVNAISDSHHHFLSRFLDCHPLESLAIPGPLLVLFKTLCSSKPEIPFYGKVYPRVPAVVGPNRRDQFMRQTLPAFFLPNIPGIIALLENLHTQAELDPPAYPRRKKHIPVNEQAALFGHKMFPALDARTDQDSWSLCSPGLQYPCEADAKLNEAFAERYEDYEFPHTAPGDSLRSITNFLHMKNNLSWFNQAKEVANSAASFFNDSGTLADCSPHGMVANQLVVQILDAEPAPQVPRRLADPLALYQFAYKLKTTARNLPPLAEATAASSQTHIRMCPNHPFLSNYGRKQPADGPFWDIRPIGSSSSDLTAYLSVPTMVKRSIKTKSSTN